jgi:uncharacterized membrane protein/nitrite reductase/ring-hydroxylating ferredoxin subunit
MRSRAHFRSHPLHPILVVFPVAFFTGAFVFDILSFIFRSAASWQTGTFLIYGGLAGGLLAVIPGLVDFIYTVPPRSSAKKRAARHGWINVAVMALFASALFFREESMEPAVLLLEAPAVGLLCYAGWLGGTLVHRNQIGVDGRYAGAGKWKEETISAGGGTVRVATSGELENDQMKLLRIGGVRIVLARTESGYVAFSDRCPHRGGSLAGGMMICGVVQCPWHGSQFEAGSGRLKAGPAKEGIVTYAVEERAGEVFLSVGSNPKP